MVCHTALLDKPTSIASYSRSPDRRVSMHRWATSLLMIWKSQFPSLHWYSGRHLRSTTGSASLPTSTYCLYRAACTDVPANSSQVIGDSLFGRFAHHISLSHPSTDKRNVVSTELAYLLGQPCVLVRLLAVRCRAVLWHAQVQLYVPR